MKLCFLVPLFRFTDDKDRTYLCGIHMSAAPAAPGNVFVSGDVVISNPKESAALFALIVILSVLLENLISSLREHRSKHVKLLFLQLSEEVLIVGTISLLFVFVVQTVDNMPARWILLFRWTQTVLFFLVVFFVCGIIFISWLIHFWLAKFDDIEKAVDLAALGSSVAQGTDLVQVAGSGGGASAVGSSRMGGGDLTAPLRTPATGSSSAASPDRRATHHRRLDYDELLELQLSWSQRMFVLLRRSFHEQLDALEESLLAATTSNRRQHATQQQKVLAHSLRKCGEAGISVSFVGYLRMRCQGTVVKFTDITWQCWLSLVFVAAANSVRLFLLPGRFQSRDISTLSTDDRVLNTVTYIFIIGWVPMTVYLVGLAMLYRNFSRYLQRLKTSSYHEQQGGHQTAGSGGEHDPHGHGGPSASPTKANGVWLPPKQLTAHLMGTYDDPSFYLLRSNRSFTLHILKVPILCTELYFAIFIGSMWGEISSTFGVKQLIVLPVALLPIVVILLSAPLAIGVTSVLTSLGSRLDRDSVVKVIGQQIKIDHHNFGATPTERGGSNSGTRPRGAGDEDEEDDRNSGIGDDDVEMIDALTREVNDGAAGGSGDASGRNRGNGGIDLEQLDSLLTAREQRRSQSNAVEAQLQQEVASCKARIRFLEDLCVTYGVPIGKTTSGDGRPAEFSIATLSANVNQVQEQNTRILEMQSRLVAFYRQQSALSSSAATWNSRSMGGVSGGARNGFDGSPQATIDTMMSSATRATPGSGMRPSRPLSTDASVASAHLNDFSRAAASL